MASVTNSAPLRFLASSAMNGYVMDYHTANIKYAVLEDGITGDGNWVAHTWRSNALSTLRHLGHKDAAVAAASTAWRRPSSATTR